LEEKYTNLECYSNLREFSKLEKRLNFLRKYLPVLIIGLYLLTFIYYFASLPHIPLALNRYYLFFIGLVEFLFILYHMAYIRQTAYTVIKSAIPYNDLPLRIKQEQFYLMKDILSSRHLTQFNHEISSKSRWI